MMNIRKKFAVLTALVGVLLAIVSITGYFLAYHALNESIQGEITANMASEQEELSGWVREHTRIAEDLAAHAAAIDALGGRPPLALFTPSKDEMLLGLSVTREDGVLMNWPAGDLTEKIDPRTRAWYQDAKAAGHTIYTDPYTDAATNKLCMSIATPYYGANHELGGVICEDVSLASLSEYVSRLNYKGAGTGMILSSDGTVVAAADEDLVGQTTAEIGSLHEHFSEMQQKGKGYFLTDVNGRSNVIAYDTVDGTNWFMLLAVPEDVVFSQMRTLKITFLGLTLVSILLVLLLTQAFAKRITEPVIKLKSYAEEMAQGNFKLEDCRVDSQDELGQLAQSFNTMLHGLRSLLRDIMTTSEQVAAAAEELTANSEQSAQASQSVAQTIVDVANGMEQQLSSVDGVKTHVDTVYENVNEMQEKTTHIVSRSTATADAAASGKKLMENSIARMEEIEASVHETAEVMTTLGANSKEISAIVETISSIAEQTNLLALNAAIEAARAGEQGRGFSVVADEVRKLAEESQAAAGEISERIGNIQKDTEDAVARMQAGTARVQAGTTAIREVGDQFRDIMEEIMKTKEEVTAIHQTMQNLAENTQGIVGAVDTIDEVSRKTSEHTQTISAAAEEQGASTEEIASASHSLADLADKLQQAAAKFKA